MPVMWDEKICVHYAGVLRECGIGTVVLDGLRLSFPSVASHPGSIWKTNNLGIEIEDLVKTTVKPFLWAITFRATFDFAASEAGAIVVQE
jgi:hypothetical protein